MFNNYLMWDEVTGEEFIVEAPNEIEALRIANTYFDDPYIHMIITDRYAELLGLDTY